MKPEDRPLRGRRGPSGDGSRESPAAAASGRAADAEIAGAFRRGSPGAVEAVRARVRRILGFRGAGVPVEERRDLEQEVMTQLWQAVNRSRFDPAAGLWGLVEVVAARRLIDWFRAQRPTAELVEEVEDPARGPLRTALGRERTRLLYAALAELDEPCRSLLQLRVGEGLPYRDLAARLGRSEGALRVQMHRCVRQLRGLLERRSGQPDP